ncbi:hypothetical protein Ancab_002278, partial [Ancistrocladus abbreviatus]
SKRRNGRGNLFKHMDGDGVWKGKQRIQVDEISEVESDESLSTTWVSKSTEAVEKRNSAVKLPTAKHVTRDTEVEQEKIQKSIENCVATLIPNEEDGAIHMSGDTEWVEEYTISRKARNGRLRYEQGSFNMETAIVGQSEEEIVSVREINGPMWITMPSPWIVDHW